MGRADRARDRAGGALARAHRAALALRRVDRVAHELRALAGAALLVADVLEVLVHEVLERRAHGVGGGLAEAAERRLVHRVADLPHVGDVLLRAVAGADLLQVVEELAPADAARRALAAALVHREVEVELRDVHHAVRLVHDDEAARAHDRADLRERLVVDRRVEELRRDDAAGGPAGLRRLELVAAADAAADVEDDLAQGGAHRDLDEAGVVHLAREREHLRALRRRRADLAEPLRALVDDDGDVRERLDVVDDRRTPPEALDGRERRTRTRHAAVALDGLQQGGLLAADERAGAEAELDLEVEAAAEDVLAEEPELRRLPDRHLEAVDRERVFGADVDEALGRADRVAGDDHGLEDAVGVALQRRAVHVGAGVALVRVADHVLLPLGLGLRELPLEARREAGAAAAAEAGLQHLLDDLLRRHLEEHLLDRLVAVARDVVLDLLRVDDAAVAQDDAVLLLVERDVRLGDELLRLLRVVAEALDDAALDEVLGDDLLDVVLLHLDVERALGEDLDDRALLAEAEAAGLDDLDLVLEPGKAEARVELGDEAVRAAGAARRAAADENIRLIGHDLTSPVRCPRLTCRGRFPRRFPCR